MHVVFESTLLNIYILLNIYKCIVVFDVDV